MNRYVIDAWAWVEYLRGRRSDIKDKIEKNHAITNVITISEIVSKFEKEGLDVDGAFNAIVSLSRTVYINAGFAKDAGMLHSGIKKMRPNFSLADAFVLQTARDMKAKVLTGDSDFKGLREAEMLK